MQEQKEYLALLKELVGLQLKLARTFEAEVTVMPLSSDFPVDIRDKLKNVIKAGLSVSQVLSAWPDGVGVVPLRIWIKPTRGTIELEGRNWFFDVHGLMQIYFLGLPSELDTNVLESLKTGKSDAFVTSPGYGPNVEVQYLKGGRVDSVSAWSVSLFAESIGSSLGNLAQSDHEAFLKQLVDEGVLFTWPLSTSDRDCFFVLAESEMTP